MAQGEISPLILDEYLAAGDGRFLAALRQFHEPRKLGGIADKWKKDHRPWARQQIFAYLELPLDRPGHEPVVKRLFKWAEERGDDELMAAFAVAFDRLVRHVRRKRHRWDWQTRRSFHEEYLFAPRNTVPHVGKGTRVSRDPRTLQPVVVGARRRMPRDGRLFSYHTRYYLRRRAWRYFRRAAFKRPKDYATAVAGMLRRYTDADLTKGEDLLDSWSLVQACFGESEVLAFGASTIKVRDERSLAELTAAPSFPHLSQARAAARTLVALLLQAHARPVRVWAMQLLRKHHVEHFAAFSAGELLPLLDHADEQVQQFAAEMLERSETLTETDVATWLKLLQTRSQTALETITRLMLRHVKPERLTLDQMVDLANARPVPVARLGLSFLRTQRIETPDQRQTIARLSSAQSPSAAGEIATWALSVLGTREHYDADTVSRFFDSLLQPARDAAWGWLVAATGGSPAATGDEGDTSVAPTADVRVPAARRAAGSPGWNDPALWSRLIETPYDDVRFHVVAALEHRTTLPGAADAHVAAVWSAVLLGIHRGGRSKLAALRQVSRAIQENPARAEPLLPVLAVAIRSVRMPEVRTGLSAVVAAVAAHPPLTAAVAKHLPELQLLPEEAPA